VRYKIENNIVNLPSADIRIIRKCILCSEKCGGWGQFLRAELI